MAWAPFWTIIVQVLIAAIALSIALVVLAVAVGGTISILRTLRAPKDQPLASLVHVHNAEAVDAKTLTDLARRRG